MQLRNGKIFASIIHLFVSTVFVVFITSLLFNIWYPNIYRDISGSNELLLLLIVVNVGVGPLITLVLYNRDKPRRELTINFILVGLLQVVALGYGLRTAFEARPIHLVFEYHRLAIVHAADVDPSTLHQAPQGLRVLPLTGPTLLSLRPFKNADEQLQSTMMAINGVPQAAQPLLWQPWNASRSSILEESRPISDLMKRFGAQSALIKKSITATGLQPNELRYLPLLARKSGWTVLIDSQSTEPIGFLPLDSF